MVKVASNVLIYTALRGKSKFGRIKIQLSTKKAKRFIFWLLKLGSKIFLINYSDDGLSVSEVLFVLPVGLPAKNCPSSTTFV
jgi:hypothetical protein